MVKNVHGHTLDILGQSILAGRYAVGASLPPEPLLCEEFGVSRTVVREAIKSLVAKGLLFTGPKVGTRVLPDAHWNWFDPDVVAWQAQCGLTPEFLKDLQELRRVVEPAAVRLAAERATADDIAQIEEAYAGMKKAVEEGGDYVTYDMRFHQGLLQASHNRMLIQMSKALNALLRTSFEISTRIKDGTKNSLPLHRAVLNAVISHEPAKAERAIMVLIEGASEDIDQVLASRKKLPVVSGRPTPIKTQPKPRATSKLSVRTKGVSLAKTH
ncbi:FadR/GntR family transcriptional regulator [Limnohabitans parvus]|uniref:GntR family transcriptional regulator n=1 Tax=Limnohabitans parvus II-B4 TaxID=1293052 RepID=A0A315FQE4_9BURK|nr:FadR/GntR family transcriptional regulator [Limnohabitans parvus]PUE55477.1 GntR family transcriptional regulator [Limnohabitans parvus II-B4]